MHRSAGLSVTPSPPEVAVSPSAQRSDVERRAAMSARNRLFTISSTCPLILKRAIVSTDSAVRWRLLSSTAGTSTAMESSTRTGEIEPASVEPAELRSATRSAPAARGRQRRVDARGSHRDAGDHGRCRRPRRCTPRWSRRVRERCAGVRRADGCRSALLRGVRRTARPAALRRSRTCRPAQPAGRPPARGSRRSSGMSANSTLIAGIGTLLLAMGVGVLIGRSGNGSSAKSSGVQVVDVGGAGQPRRRRDGRNGGDRSGSQRCGRRGEQIKHTHASKSADESGGQKTPRATAQARQSGQHRHRQGLRARPLHR